ncbi:MAG: hypothetical protein ACLFTQ_00120 [Candidatus Aenigmatarchaeota archaeon]
MIDFSAAEVHLVGQYLLLFLLGNSQESDYGYNCKKSCQTKGYPDGHEAGAREVEQEQIDGTGQWQAKD